ncbi:NitT/TauT family transport system substrate-binding protein [Agrobacterium larrymoorei]|uniref:NitT/TauT family transport system substrate-binding protein n=1 Tax=Agrobacterium larrymoorei TaxID=160699 RepID=A0AAJ2EU52_9HYPH|nr:ABC transporter substrate-binding protein [Agrobacterium larrymoorei]MDR6104724.1 NitT/TauT family transport system substrate-binding protein [Agrobacterium larrymoorei]
MFTRRLFSKTAALAAISMFAGISAAPLSALADTPIKFTLDWKFEGPSAGFLLALDKGYFKAEGLDVTIDSGNGSVEAIPRVATGAYQMGFGDINSVMKFLDEDPSQKVKAVYMVYERPTFAVVGRKSLGVTEDPKSLEGKKLGAPPPDGAFAQWKAFKEVAKIDDSKITIQSIGFPVREPMLAKGDVDAVFGFAFSVILNLKAQGISDDDIATILMAEHGLNLYGNSVLVNTDFAKENPQAVKGFLKALAKGFADAVKNPEEGVAAVLKRNETLNPDIELQRLNMANSMNIKTPYVIENGMGGVDQARLAASMETLKISIGLKGNVKAEQVFDASYLPPKEERMLP